MESTPATFKKVKIALLGATGATGREIVRHAMKDPRIEELCIIVRRRLDEWKEENFICKLKVIQLDTLDKMATSDTKEQIQGYDALLSTMGSRIQVGEAAFRKVEQEYTATFAKIGLESGARYYGLLSGEAANAKSWLLLMRVKGEIEDDFKKLGYKHLAIHRPGLLLDRDNDERLVETVGKFIPFISKV